MTRIKFVVFMFVVLFTVNNLKAIKYYRGHRKSWSYWTCVKKYMRSVGELCSE